MRLTDRALFLLAAVPAATIAARVTASIATVAAIAAVSACVTAGIAAIAALIAVVATTTAIAAVAPVIASGIGTASVRIPAASIRPGHGSRFDQDKVAALSVVALEATSETQAIADLGCLQRLVVGLADRECADAN